MSKRRIYEVSEVQEYFQDKLKCGDCEFCFANEQGLVCAGSHYGKQLSEEDVANNPICEGEEISLDTYMKLEEKMYKELNNG